MISPSLHRIRRQHWLVKAPSSEAAFAIRRQLRSQLDTGLQPILEHAFDSLGVGAEVVRIPRLSLALKLRPGEEFIAALGDALRKELDIVLRDVIIRPEQTVQRMSASASRRRTLLHYLATGHVEWHAAADDTDNLANMLHSEASALAAETRALPTVITGSLVQRIAISFRLLQLLPDTERAALLEVAPLHTDASPPQELPAEAAMAVLLPAILQQLAASGAVDHHLLLRVQALLLALRKEDLYFPLSEDILSLLRECIEQIPLRATHATLHVALRNYARSSHVAHDIQRTAFRSPSRAEQIPAVSPQTNANTPASTEMPRTASWNDETSGVAMTDSKASSELPYGWPAYNAGLVLLHPFLPRLFDAVGITTGETPALPEAMLPRAAAILHWLASGDEEIYEFELTAIKILLGLAPNDALLTDGGLLDEVERAEADALLTAAISHWTALGQTSVAGLRTSFLQRRGLLRDAGNSWQLQVEPESFDMLLGSLPWSINIVKLPWMTRPIFIDWPMP